jgi:hypothetical protein
MVLCIIFLLASGLLAKIGKFIFEDYDILVGPEIFLPVFITNCPKELFEKVGQFVVTGSIFFKKCYC